MIAQISAVLASIVLTALGIFQAALILGYPLGKYAWGGAHEVLPRPYKIGSAVAIGIYAFTISVLCDRAGILNVYPEGLIKSHGIWVLTAYFALGIFMNAISRSKPERNLMTPVAASLFILGFAIATA